MVKKYKPGQLFTVNGHVYRFTKKTDQTYKCNHCPFEDQYAWLEPCFMCMFTNLFPENCYFKLVKLCTKQDK